MEQSDRDVHGIHALSAKDAKGSEYRYQISQKRHYLRNKVVCLYIESQQEERLLKTDKHHVSSMDRMITYLRAIGVQRRNWVESWALMF